MNETLETVVNTELDSLDLELVELQQRGTRSRPVLDVRIDRRDGEKITVDDCARASRALEARLDGGALVAERYVLEVSSPGVERAIRTVSQWRRFLGRKANVSSAALGGRAEVEIVAIEGDMSEEVAVLRDAKGAEHRLPLGEITDARLAFHW